LLGVLAAWRPGGHRSPVRRLRLLPL